MEHAAPKCRADEREHRLPREMASTGDPAPVVGRTAGRARPQDHSIEAPIEDGVGGGGDEGGSRQWTAQKKR